jgi:hypothetical protein
MRADQVEMRKLANFVSGAAMAIWVIDSFMKLFKLCVYETVETVRRIAIST